MLQIILTLVIFVLLIIPIGRYMFHIATGQHTFCDPVFNRIDNGIYRICGINQNEGMGWKKYALALVLTPTASAPWSPPSPSTPLSPS